ncbi:MAG: hypothetical protein PVI30_06105 [Myxococcales bacterium]|jgi:hypothetical protein
MRNAKSQSEARHVVIRVPSLGPQPSDPWVDETYALIDGMARDSSPADRVIETPSIIAASDYLWARYGLEAAWDRLDVEGLFALFAGFAVSPRWRADCMATLQVFYRYLVKMQVIDPDAGSRIQAELLAHRTTAETELARSGEPLHRANRRARRARAARARGTSDRCC